MGFDANENDSKNERIRPGGMCNDVTKQPSPHFFLHPGRQPSKLFAMFVVRFNALCLIRRACFSTVTTVQSQSKSIAGPFTGKDHHVCGCFISIYNDTFELTSPTFTHAIHKVASQRRGKSKGQEQVVIMNASWSIASPRALRHLTRDDVTTIEVQATGTRVIDAKQMARVQIANQLYTMLKKPDDFMPGKGRKKQIEFVIPVRIDLAIQDNINKQLEQLDLEPPTNTATPRPLPLRRGRC